MDKLSVLTCSFSLTTHDIRHDASQVHAHDTIDGMRHRCVKARNSMDGMHTSAEMVLISCDMHVLVCRSVY